MKKMQKLLSLLTVGVLTFGMSTTAFAAPLDGYVSSMTVTEVVSYLENSGASVDSSFVDLCENIIEMKNSGMSTTEILTQIEKEHVTYSLYDTWGRLTDSEKLLVVTYPKEAIAIQGNATKSNDSTVSIYGYNGNGDVTDSYRHGYWNALNARDAGKTVAEAFATAHEDISDEELNKVSAGFTGWQHRSMDLHNNEIGRSVVNWNDWFTSDSTMSNRVLEQIEKGNMVILVKQYEEK